MYFDDESKQVIESVVSTMLPHENYDPTLVPEILNETFRAVPLDDMEMEFYVMFRILNDMSQIKLPGKFPKLTRDSFEVILENIVINESLDPKIRLKDYLLMQGELADLSNQDNLDNARNILYSLCMRLYDNAFEKKQPSEGYPALILALKENILSAYAYNLVNTQGLVLKDGVQFGRDFVQGPHAWLGFVKRKSIELDNRFNGSEDQDTLILDNANLGRMLLESNQMKDAVLAPMGIDPMDQATPLMRNRLLVLAGAPNIGKTTIMLSWVINLVMEGRKVVILSGESTPAIIFSQLLSSYIHRKYGLFITDHMIRNLGDCTPEEARIIGLYTEEFSSLCQVAIRRQFSYETFFEQASALREKFEYDALFVDHTLSMGGLRSQYEDLGKLAFQARELKIKYPVCVCLLTHLSVTTTQELREGRPLSDAPCAKGNGSIDGEADEILVMTSNENLYKRGQIGFLNKKRRGAPVVKDLMVVRVDFQYKQLTYKEEDQFGNAEDYLKREAAVEMIKAAYDYEDEEDDGEGGELFL